MEVLGILGVLIALFLLIGAVLGWVALLKVNSSAHRIRALEKRLAELTGQQVVTSQRPDWVKPERSDAEPLPPIDTPEYYPESQPETLSEPLPQAVGSHETPVDIEPAARPAWLEKAKSMWMVWLGGASIGLAGIFLVKYSIDQGLLGPLARVIVGLISGVGLHLAAEFWRRKASHHYASIPALAGGASITLFAALLAALHLYQLWPPMVVFTGLVIVSMATMLLALVQGPVLAIIGILGAFAVPVLVSTGSHNVNGALIYSLIVATSAFALMHWVYRPWLWLGTLAGAGLWFVVGLLPQMQNPGWLGIYLTIFAYLMAALKDHNFLLQRTLQPLLIETTDPLLKRLDMRVMTLLLLLIGQSVALVLQPDWSYGWFNWLPLLVILFVLTRNNPGFSWLPWLALLTQAAAFLVAIWMRALWYESGQYLNTAPPGYLIMILLEALVFFLFSLWNQTRAVHIGRSASLTWLSPVIWMAVCYATVFEIHGSWGWFVMALLLGLSLMGYVGLRVRSGDIGVNTAWLVIAAHAAYSIAVVILFSQASLTLALALQVLSLVWISRRYQLENVESVVKGLLAIVVIRLTMNPWLLSYPDYAHWSLWTYGGSFAVIAAAAWLCQSGQNIKPWLTAVALHLLVLFLNTEIRYWLYDGVIFQQEYSFTEAAINTSLWGAMAIIYFYRSQFSARLARIYLIGAKVLMLMAVVNFGAMLTLYNPLFSSQPVGTIPVFSLLIIAYGLPALIAWLASRYFFPAVRQYCLLFAGFTGWFYISLEIRHIWQSGEQLVFWRFTSNAELYTYSLVWLVMAGLALILGIIRENKNIYRTGLALLGLVVAKIFLVDMSGLSGLLRVLSFMGLGLCLLGLAFLHQFLSARKQESVAEKI
ncbi:DUF2339 domain-containing protein [Gynuella sunshinyii]|uniref:Putative membrane protein n=1 Tax=Gynuella sunshinyii YC6258 TaxID=1445510 RepID=A0A0C5VS95_9GAMM|nr:DUF2339 domain-containing protein [Gynuella sunshinyii]AJQ93144.1 putative membrane protein [Gynuella sunshinyii YC6258]